MNNETPRIRLTDAVSYFDTKANLARELRINPQAITNWGDYLPELRVYKLLELHPQAAKVLIKMALNNG